MIIRSPALITGAHRVEAFDCGNGALNQYLKRFALANTAAGTARTYVATFDEGFSVVGYYSLAAGSIEKASVPDRIAKGIPNHPVPVVLLARLAVDGRFQGRGIGKGLLRDALQRVLSASGVIGIRAILVHAKDDGAAGFYAKFGFAPSPIDPLLWMLLLKDLRHTLGL